MSVCIVGWSHSRFGKFDGADLETLITGVTRDAIAHAEIPASAIDALWLGNYNGGLVAENFCSSLILQADEALRWKPATRVENACASGSAAIYSACDAIEAGRAKIALVVGAEKMTAVSGEGVTRALGSAAYASEIAAGATFPGIFASIAQAYFARYGDHSATLARIAAKNHANGGRNPYAHLRKDLALFQAAASDAARSHNSANSLEPASDRAPMSARLVTPSACCKPVTDNSLSVNVPVLSK